MDEPKTQFARFKPVSKGSRDVEEYGFGYGE